MVVQEDGELELGYEGLGEGDGGEFERDIELERRRDAEFGEWVPSQTPLAELGGAVCGGERAEGVGGSRLGFFFFFLNGKGWVEFGYIVFGLNGFLIKNQ